MLNCKEGNEKISFRCPLFIHLVELPYSPLGKTPLRIEKIRLQTLIFAVTLHSENKTDTVFVRRFAPYRNDSPFFFVRRSTQKTRRAPFPSEEILDKNDKPYFFRAKKHSENKSLIKTETNMKTTMKSMMVIGMMILGTMTTLGNTTTNVHNNKSHFVVRTTVVSNTCNKRHGHDRCCNINRKPVMREKLRAHILKGNHNFDRHGVCKKCNLSRSEVRRMENELLRHDRNTCPPRPNHR